MAWRCGRRSAQARTRPADDQQDRDLPWLPEVVLDEALPEASRDHRGDRADGDGPGEPLISALDRAPADGDPQRLQQPDDVGPKVGEHGDQRPGVKRDVERLVEGLVVLQEAVILEPGNEDQVTGGRDRQKLGQPLDHPQQERL